MTTEIMSSSTELDRGDCIATEVCLSGSGSWHKDAMLDHIDAKPNNDGLTISDDITAAPIDLQINSESFYQKSTSSSDEWPTVHSEADAELIKSTDVTDSSVPASIPLDIIASSFGVDLTSTVDVAVRNVPSWDNPNLVLKPSLPDEPSFQIGSGHMSEFDLQDQRHFDQRSHLDQSSHLDQLSHMDQRGHLDELDHLNQQDHLLLVGQLDQAGHLDQGGHVDQEHENVCEVQSSNHEGYWEESGETLPNYLEDFVTNISKLTLPVFCDVSDVTSSGSQCKTSLASRQIASDNLGTWTLQGASETNGAERRTLFDFTADVDGDKTATSVLSAPVSSKISRSTKLDALCKGSVSCKTYEISDLNFEHPVGAWPNGVLSSEHLMDACDSLSKKQLSEEKDNSCTGLGTELVYSVNPMGATLSLAERPLESESSIHLATAGEGGADNGERTSGGFAKSLESLMSDKSSELMEEDEVAVDRRLLKDDDLGGSLKDDVMDGSLKDYVIGGALKDDVSPKEKKKSLMPAFGNDFLCKTLPSSASDASAVSSSSTLDPSREERNERKNFRKDKASSVDSANKTDDCLVTSVIRFAAPCPAVAQSTSYRTSSTTFPVLSSSSSASSSTEVPQNITLSPPQSSNINLPITHLGKVAPTWLPDSEAPRCMQCETPFSFTRRRHHCRACGKIFCGSCSGLRATIKYLENKESRVCSKCYQDLIRAKYYQQTHRKSHLKPNPNNPSEYCSVVSPLLQVQSLTPVPLPTIMVPTTGVLRKQGSLKSHTEAKQVMFADGIRPGGDLTEADGFSSMRLTPGHAGRRTKRVERTGPTDAPGNVPVKPVVEMKRGTCLIPAFGGLPPIVVASSSSASSSSSLSHKDYSLLDSPTMEFVLHHLCNVEDPKPVTFVIDQYLAVIVSVVKLDCCMHRICWSFTTKGMRNAGQDELVILLECLPEERTLPLDVFHHFYLIYQQASQGNPVLPLCHTVLPPGAFGCMDHGGFLFIRRTYQCREKLILPEPPYLFGILLQKWEMSWAKVFPLRLLLRLGAEFRYYPCPLVGVRNRQPVYGEVGHTIMNLLADFHNYQYMVPQITGLVIRLQDKKATIKIPCNRYDAVMKVLNSANDHVVALGADFCVLADSHLVCVQNEDGNYQTQAINIQNKPCKETGASFIVFNGALKPTSGLLAKWSIVEDGVMVQVTSSMMTELKQSWKEMKNYIINCSSSSSSLNSADEVVAIEWIDDKDFFTLNVGVKSPVDGKSMQGTESRCIHGATDFACEGHVIRWTEIFLLSNELTESANVSRFTELLAQAACLALVPHATLLTLTLKTKIGLRITIGSNDTSFKAGSKGQPLPGFCINDLEEKLMPLLQKFSLSLLSSSSGSQGNIIFELILYVLHMNSTIADTPCIVMSD